MYQLIILIVSVGRKPLNELFAQSDGVAFREEDDAVEGVGNDEERISRRD